MGTYDAPPPGSSGLVPLRAGSPAAPAEAVVPEAPAVPFGTPTREPVRTTAGDAHLRWDGVHSRRRASVTTFGLGGRIAITVVVVLLLVWLVLSSITFLVVVVPLGIVSYIVLRDVWAVGSQPRPQPPMAPASAHWVMDPIGLTPDGGSTYLPADPPASLPAAEAARD